MKMSYLIILIFVALTASASEEKLVTLNKGECILVDERVLCWSYQPSYLSRPDEPPQQCDLRKDCPITYNIPPNADNRIYLPEERFELGGTITRICREERTHGQIHYKLMQIKIQANGNKSETEIAEFENGRICKEYEYEYSAKQEEKRETVILETYQKPAKCPQVKQTKIKRKQFKLHWKRLGI